MPQKYNHENICRILGIGSFYNIVNWKQNREVTFILNIITMHKDPRLGIDDNNFI
jgi:hypothetical protein